MSAPSEKLLAYRDTWQRKAVLREVYADYYRRMVRACVPGTTLEIGGGIGSLKDHANNVITTDIQFAPWLDSVADAQFLPFADRSFDNIVMLDVLHHIEWPRRFLSEATRLLRGKGRLVIVEPAVTAFSTPAYKWLHHEAVDLSADPLADAAACSGRDPYEANSAIPALIFGKHRLRLEQTFPELRLLDLQWMTAIPYLLSGGFQSWSLLPRGLVSSMQKIDNVLSPLCGRWFGFRMFAVLERA